eukprot:SAG31_NODE_2770_length_5116_cov_3.834164_5_plen_112_part_00
MHVLHAMCCKGGVAKGVLKGLTSRASAAAHHAQETATNATAAAKTKCVARALCEPLAAVTCHPLEMLPTVAGILARWSDEAKAGSAASRNEVAASPSRQSSMLYVFFIYIF